MLPEKHREGGKLQEGLAVGSDVSMADISRSRVFSKFHPTVPRTMQGRGCRYPEACLSSLRLQSCHLGSEEGEYGRGGSGVGFVSWSCRTLVSLCLRLLSSAARVCMKCTFLKSCSSPWKAPFLSLSCSHQVAHCQEMMRSTFFLAKRGQ